MIKKKQHQNQKFKLIKSEIKINSPNCNFFE